jgi:hypothetical protein
MPDAPEHEFYSRSNRRRRSVKQLLFVVAGSHTGAFLGSSLPTTFGLPGNVSGVLLVAFLFALPFVVDENWEWVDEKWIALTGRTDDGDRRPVVDPDGLADGSVLSDLAGDGDAADADDSDTGDGEGAEGD